MTYAQQRFNVALKIFYKVCTHVFKGGHHIIAFQDDFDIGSITFIVSIQDLECKIKIYRDPCNEVPHVRLVGAGGNVWVISDQDVDRLSIDGEMFATLINPRGLEGR